MIVDELGHVVKKERRVIYRQSITNKNLESIHCAIDQQTWNHVFEADSSDTAYYKFIIAFKTTYARPFYIKK